VTRTVEPVAYTEEIAADIEPAARRTMGQIYDGAAIPSEYFEPEVERLAQAATPLDPPDHLPQIGNLLVAHDGTFWVERADRHPRPASRSVAQAAGSPSRNANLYEEWLAPSFFDRFTAEGEYTGTVTLPDRFIAMAAAPDRLFGVMVDEFDVQYVVGFAVLEGAR
jgi:hypothetical protein